MGFGGFEIDGKQLLENFEQVKEAVYQTNFPVVTACGGYRGSIGDFDDTKRKQAINDICAILDKLSSIARYYIDRGKFPNVSIFADFNT